MKNSIKGAIATGGAAVILLGGAGSLAYWNSTDAIAGGVINSGNLIIDAAACDDADFTVENSIEGVAAGTDFDVATQEIVPGDKLTKTCDVDIVAVGTNLRADLEVVEGTDTGALGDYVTVDPTFQIDGVDLTQITDDNSGDVVTATIVVDFPIGTEADNASKLKTLTIGDYTITATQVFS